MNIISVEEIEKLYRMFEPKIDVSNNIAIEDESLATILEYYLFLEQFDEEIISEPSYTYERVLYSQYCWFVYFKHHYFSLYGYDGGMEQQAFQLIEKISNEFGGEANWQLLEDIDQQWKMDR